MAMQSPSTIINVLRVYNCVASYCVAAKEWRILHKEHGYSYHSKAWYTGSHLFLVEEERYEKMAHT